MDGGDTNLGGLKIHHDDSRPTSPSGSAGPVFESFEANTPTVPSTPPAQTENPTPPILTNTPTDTQPNIAQVNEPVNIPPNTTPTPPVPFTPQNMPNTPAAPVNSTFSAEPNVLTGVNNFNNLAPQSPVFSPVISQPMDTEIIDNRFDMAEGYNMEPKNPKRGKKILIILVLLLLIGGIGVGVWLGVKGGEKNQEEIMGNSFDAYKRYANYLLYGEESTKNIESDVIWELQNMIPEVTSYNTEERNEYSDNLKKLYEDFSEIFKKTDINAKYEKNAGLVKDLYENTGAGVKSLSEYLKVENISASDMALEYLRKGANGMLDIVDANYPEDSASEDNLYGKFVIAKRREAESIATLYNYYASIGCIADGVIDENCIDSHVGEEELTSLTNSLNSISDESDSLEYHIIFDILSSSSNLYSLLMEATSE